MDHIAIYQRLKNLNESSLGRRFLSKYIVLILIPLLIVSSFLSFSIVHIYRTNDLYQQNVYLNSIMQTWNTPGEQSRFIINALQSSQELLNFLEEKYYTQPERLYIYKKTLHTLFTELMRINDNIDSIRIYCTSPNILMADPFCHMDSIPLTEDEMQILDAANPYEFVWFVGPSDDLSTPPEFYAYCNIYTSTYARALGHLELKMNMKFLEEYTWLLNHDPYNKIGFSLYDAKDFLIYENLPFSLSSNTKKGFMNASDRNGFEHGYYFFKYFVEEQNLNLLITISEKGFLSNYLLSMAFMTFALTAFLYLLSLLYFREISRLTRRISLFSVYLKEYNRKELRPYYEHASANTGRTSCRHDEFTDLIESFNQMVTRNNTLTSQIQTLELLNRDAKLAAMQAQIHPHFIYGTLETIRMLAMQNDDTETEDIVYSFSRLMRYSLNHPSEQSSLLKEVEVNRHYMKIQQLRLDDRMDFLEAVDQDLMDLHCPPFIIQPLLENAIVHGISQSLSKCTLQLKIYQTDKHYFIQIIDNADVAAEEKLAQINAGLNQERPKISETAENGFALKNVADRLMLFYHGHAGLQLYKTGVYTISEIKIEK